MEKLLDFLKKITLKQWAAGLLCTTLVVMAVMICVVAVKAAPMVGMLMGGRPDTPAPSTTENPPPTQDTTPTETTQPSTPPVTTEPGHVHDFKLSKVTKANCTNSGFSLYACECGQVEARDFTDPLGHSYGAGKVVAATCTEEGGTYYTCSVCGYKRVRDAKPALGHNFSEWKRTQAPTATQEGVETRTCMECGEQETRSIPAIGGTTEPTQPTQPTEPSQPTDPTQPTQPTEPSEPTQPTDPTESSEPTQPTDPTESGEPSGNGEEPGTSESGEPAQP